MDRDVDWQSQNDEAVFAALSERNEGALRELIARHSAVVYSVCFKMLKRGFDAEEVTADVFAELWERSDRFDSSRSSGRTYLLLLTRSRCLDKIRAAKRLTDRVELGASVEGLPHSMLDEPEAAVQREELTTILQGGLNELTPPQREAIQMAFFDGMTHPEIADAMKAPLGSVKSHIRRGLKRLRNLIVPPGTVGD
ncbi:MAG: sigma-70 family RNA polymerase sigma factor [Planctomycetota bacterium]